MNETLTFATGPVKLAAPPVSQVYINPAFDS
jgi:hypothetical protein